MSNILNVSVISNLIDMIIGSGAPFPYGGSIVIQSQEKDMMVITRLSGQIFETSRFELGVIQDKVDDVIKPVRNKPKLTIVK